MTAVVHQQFCKINIPTVIVGEKHILKNMPTFPIALNLKPDAFEIRDYVEIPDLNTIVGSFENKTSRNLPYRVDKIKEVVAKHVPKKGDACVILIVANAKQGQMAALSVSRLWHLYNKKSTAETRTVFVQVFTVDGSALDLNEIQTVSNSIRNAQLLMDTPCSELSTMEYIKEATEMVAKLGSEASIQVINGQALEKEFGGIFGVGKGANSPPALVILKYTPKAATKTIALVGKGIMYDTGGLSLKATASMCTMKFDMGGSAAVFGAFQTIVKQKVQKNVYALLCVAENAIGPNATRNDDILYMYSKKTVEVNNTDAEGRLVLADGVAYASKNLKADIIIDIATLTGAQLITTGKKHAGVLTANEVVEQQVIAAGRETGDYVFPMLYCPELLLSMFDSKVADMKNSVSDRMNAQSSCAGHFVEAHLDEDYKGQWLHIDMAGPGSEKEQSTGYGVALLYTFVKNYQ